MIGWDVYMIFALISVGMWTIGAVAAFRHDEGCSRWSVWTTMAGIVVYAVFIGGLWASLSRPPLRTLGETRLWYSLFMMVAALIVYIRWRYRWIQLFSLIVATVFICINILNPEIHDQSLMPALQSAWFVPHVTVYIFSYSVFGCAFLLAVGGLWRHSGKYLATTDQLVNIGMALLTFGMISGCIWAKQAWGSYWTWDPKETWAAATWCAYLVYVHRRSGRRTTSSRHDILSYLVLIVGFILLQMCWWGVNLLPSASSSLHSY
ncbi:MAG: cytochrome c biogenesis protein CcsA [Prevotella sp.]|nr:cytochrome c biogenesis protein CcsA [Prevotella sp.]